MSLVKNYKINLLILLLLNGLVWLAVVFCPKNEIKVIFCDVGQGDAAIISIGLTQILIDGGPDDQVIGCLGKYLPFYDQKIEAVVLTHPDADHYTGLISVLKKYRVGNFLTGPMVSEDLAYKQLISLVLTGHKIIFAGDIIRLGNYQLKVVWPDKIWAEETNKVDSLLDKKPELNKYSLFMVLQKKFDNDWQSAIVFAGDADSLVHSLFSSNFQSDLTNVSILKFPHHGSKTGMGVDFLKQLNPQKVIISVGKDNRFGHPAKETLEMLEQQGIMVHRTDLGGDFVITGK